MGEKSAYYIPHNQERFIGKVNEVADMFWEKGEFLATPDEHIYKKLNQWKEDKKELPVSQHQFSFAEMGIADEGDYLPVPSNVYDACCPFCDSEIYEEVTEVWVAEEESSIPLEDREVTCPSCNKTFKTKEVKANETGFSFARIYLWVSDIDDEDWEPSFKSTVESILGPCREIIAWDT